MNSKISENLTIKNCVTCLKPLDHFHIAQDNDNDSTFNKAIRFIAANFDEIPKEELKTLNPGLIESIITSSSLQLTTEDTLLKLILELYRENSQNATFFEYVYFSNVSSELLNEFLDTFSIDDINSTIWRSIIRSFRFDTKEEKVRYILKDVKTLMLGLDDAGKTQILYQMHKHEKVTTIPTIGFNVETIKHNLVDLNIWDVGGQGRIRSLWHHYFLSIEALVWVVDSSNSDRLDESREELDKLLKNDELKGVPVLIFANKSDKLNTLSTDKIEKRLNLDSVTDRKWKIQKCSAFNGQGLDEGLDFICEQVKLKKAQHNLDLLS